MTHLKPQDAKLLIVEDEELVSLDMRSIVEGMGVAVTGIAHTVDEALASIAAEPPHLVLLDISLNGEFEGVELARTIDRRWGIPVLFVSGHLGDKAVKGVDELNTLGYIVKPYYPINLREAVESAISTLPARASTPTG
ncbi:MAG TPA: response regulator [Candidatus Sulfotelmatobacter sp.]|nr:response regulator [Candidatus Sulfotelmatobacter sp.]HUB94668.1 response regulator [Stellaceae bacterium]